MYQEKDKYRLMIENLPDGLAYCKMVRDNTGKPVDYIFLEVNSSFEALTGLPRDHIIGKKLTELHPGIKGLGFDWIGVFDQVLAISTGQSIRFQQYLALQDSWYEITAYSDQSGYLAGVFHDITERKQAEEKSFETKEYLEKLIKYANAPIIVWDTSLLITRFNQAFENLSGYDASEVIGKKIDLLFSKNKMESALEHIQKTSSGERWKAVEIEIQRKDGEPRIVLWNSANILDKEKNNVIATIAQGQDITERKQAEEMLRESEKKWRSLVSILPDYVSLLDREDRLLFLNHYAEGFTEKEVIGSSVYQYFSTQSKEIFAKEIAECQNTGKIRKFEHTAMGDDGIMREYEDYLVPLLENNKVTGIMVISRDITERKQAEEALRTSEERYRLLVENANEVIVVAQDGMLKFVNRITSELIGYSEQELTSRPFHEFIHPDDQGMVVERHLRRLKGDVSQPRYAFRLVTRDGSIKWVEIGVVLIDWEGRPATLNFLTDITERKQAEEALQIKDWAIESSTNAIVTTDMEGNLNYVNPAFLKLWGYGSPAEVLGKPAVGFWQMAEKAAEVMEAMRTKGGWIGELVAQGKDDGFFDVHVASSMVVNAVGQPVCMQASFTDITERKQIEREFIHSERMAIAGQLAAGVAHEFNNLLSIIGGSAEYAKGIRNENEIKKSLEVIVKSVSRGAQVVKKLLTFTKKIELKKESVDLVEVIEEVLGLVKRDIENNSITVVRNYSDIPKILIDVGQIQQVFLNLIINAKNVMSKGGKLTINVEREGEFIKIQFHNTGKVINKEDLSKLFTPFFTTSMRQKKGMPGTGLGLAVSYGIVKAHNGVIKAESAKGKGTTFTVLLSVTKNENRAEVLPKTVTKAGENSKIKLKQAEILIVDDEVEIRKLFKKVLDKEDYSVTVADSGGNALNLCRKKKFDLIYLDIIMPGMDGIFVFKKIKEISPKTKIVFFTGKLIEDKVAGMYLDEGAAGFLRKPILLKDLVSYTQNILKAKNEKNLLLF